MTPHWTFSVVGEFIKLSSSLTGEGFFLLKRHTYFKPIDDNLFEINCLGMNVIKRIDRNESLVPVAGSSMTSYLDGLTTLMSA